MRKRDHEVDDPSRIPRRKPSATPAGHPLQTLPNHETASLLGGSGQRSGKALDGSVRSRMEPAFGQSLADVRVHTDAEAAQQARGLGATAFAEGEEISFAPGQYQPGTPLGQALLAHEVAHVLQQRAGDRQGHEPGAEAERGAMELNADRAAAGVMGRMAGVRGAAVPSAATGLGLQLTSCGGGGRQAEKAEPEKDEFASPWTVEAVARILSRTHPEVIRFLVDGRWTIIRFKRAFDRWQHDDGRITENEIPGLMGNTRKDRLEIRLRADMTNREAASTLFHELRHGRGDDEVNARIATEEFHIQRGWPESGPSYRNPDGTVNAERIRAHVGGSSHYNPTGKKRIGRRYEGEHVEGGWRRP